MTKRLNVITSHHNLFYVDIAVLNVFSVTEAPLFACYGHEALLQCVWSMKHVWRPELVSINNFSNIKEERINKLGSLKLGLILHFLLEIFPWNKKKQIITFHTIDSLVLSLVSIMVMYTEYVYYRCSITNNYLHWNT